MKSLLTSTMGKIKYEKNKKRNAVGNIKVS